MLGDERESRSEKLALARKKLKQFQEKSSTSSKLSARSEKRSKDNGKALSEGGFPGYSTESLGSLADSTVSDGRHVISSRRRDDVTQPVSGFQHDEQSTINSATNADSFTSSTQTTTKSDTPLDPNHQIPAVQHAGSSQNANYNQQSNVAEIPADQSATQYSPGTTADEAVKNGDYSQPPIGLNGNSFGVTRQGGDQMVLVNGIETGELGSEMNGKKDELLGHPGEDSAARGSAMGSSIVEDPSLSTNDSIDIGDSASFETLQAMNDQLRKTVEESQLNYLQLANQYQELNSHYAQLHAAYTNVNTRQEQEASSKSEKELHHLKNEVQKHLQTITVFVQEKSELQSQLRQAMEIANEKHTENQEMLGRLNQNRERLVELEKLAEEKCSGQSQLEGTLQKQKGEMEKCRREAANFQAKVIELTQDRSEANARLKVKSRELDRLQAELGDMRKEIQMKEIYIRQLTAAGAQPHLQQELEEQIGKLRDENERGKLEIHSAQTAMEHFRRESEQSREQYETYGRQLNQKILELSAQVEKLSEDKHEKDARIGQLESDLEVAKEEAGKSETGAEPSESRKDEIAEAKEHLDSVELQQQLQRALEEASARAEECAALRGHLEAREMDLVRVREELRSERGKAERLEEEVKVKSQCSTDAESLLDQLHNEKATVSRAVTQNRELKEQLTELQDKFVKMTEETMNSQSRLESAEFSVQKMEQDMSEMKEELDQKKRDCFNVEERLNLVMKESLAKTEMERKIKEESLSRTEREAELEDLKAQVGALMEQNSALTHKCNLLNAASQDTVASVFHEQDKHQVEALENEVKSLKEHLAESRDSAEEVQDLRAQLVEVRQAAQRVGNENAELHRIMQQNAEDENQNTIHVELQQALNRMTSLSNENEDLRRRLEEAETANLSLNGREDENSSVCSEHVEQKRDANGDQAVQNLNSAMGLLQERFMKAMDHNADLSDQNQHLEHLIIQLQGETETIGEYITIYQHQRKVMREKLKEKEHYLAKLSREKAGVQKKLTEVQNLVMRLLQERGAMQAYHQLPPTRGEKHPRRTPSPATTPMGPGVTHRVKTDSVSEADEERGTEQPMTFASVDGFAAIIDSPLHNGEERSRENGVEVGSEAGASECGSEDSGTAEQILRLLTEMRKPDLAEKLPPSDRNLHCTYCKGKLIVL